MQIQVIPRDCGTVVAAEKSPAEMEHLLSPAIRQLRLEYAVKQLTRREKLALLQRPDTAAELVSGGAVFEPVPGVTLDMCLEGTFHG